MSSIARSVQRRTSHDRKASASRAQRNQARDLAMAAVKQHRVGVEIAREHLEQSREEMPPDARRIFSITVRKQFSKAGASHTVALTENAGSKKEIYHNAIMVHTSQDPIKATDKASATPVSFSTQLSTVMKDPNGGRGMLLPLQRLCTNTIVK